MSYRILDLTPRNYQAECIYKCILELKEEIEEELEDTLIITNFDNGRERGYTIQYKDKEISFAVNRSSDDIVVYPFKFSTATDEDYKMAWYYKPFKFIKVISDILSYLDIYIRGINEWIT